MINLHQYKNNQNNLDKIIIYKNYNQKIELIIKLHKLKIIIKWKDKNNKLDIQKKKIN